VLIATLLHLLKLKVMHKHMCTHTYMQTTD